MGRSGDAANGIGRAINGCWQQSGCGSPADYPRHGVSFPPSEGRGGWQGPIRVVLSQSLTAEFAKQTQRSLQGEPKLEKDASRQTYSLRKEDKDVDRSRPPPALCSR